MATGLKMVRAGGDVAARGPILARFSAGKICLLLGLVVLAGYMNTFWNGFVWDDVSSIQLNQFVQESGHWKEIFTRDLHAFGRGQGNFYRPLLTLTFKADWALTGFLVGTQILTSETSPFVFHLTNLLLHLGVCILVFFFIRAVSGDLLASGLGALLYSVHPVHTSAVTYISGRADSLMTVFLLGSLLCWMRGAEIRRSEPDSVSESKGNPTLWVVGSAFLYVCALLSKEVALIFPLLPLLIDLVHPNGQLRKHGWVRRLAGFHVPFFGLMFALGILRLTVLNFAPEQAAQAEMTLAEQWGIALRVFPAYLGMILAPVDLYMERLAPGVEGLLSMEVGLSALVFFGAFALLIPLYRWSRAAFIGLAWFLIMRLPTSGIFSINAALAEHWLYEPLIGLSLVAGVGLSRLTGLSRVGWQASHSRQVVLGGAIILVALFIRLTVVQNTRWRDNFTLFTYTLEKAPHSNRIRYNLAVLLDIEPGILANQQDQWRLCVETYREVLRREPNHLSALFDLGEVLLDGRQIDAAAMLFARAIEVGGTAPDAVKARVQLGQVLAVQGRRAEAHRLWDEVVSLTQNSDTEQTISLLKQRYPL